MKGKKKGGEEESKRGEVGSRSSCANASLGYARLPTEACCPCRSSITILCLLASRLRHGKTRERNQGDGGEGWIEGGGCQGVDAGTREAETTAANSSNSSSRSKNSE